MLSLTRADVPPRRATLDAPGGFSWWYGDIVDAAGNGLVVIGAWGLPFLPGYAAAARRGAPERAGSRPSLNLALYEAGRPVAYLLQETPGEWVSDTCWRFGDSVLTSEIVNGERRLHATIDCPVAGTSARMVGALEIVGRPRVSGPDEPADGPHRWTPLATPARGEASFSLGDGFRFAVAGRAYHDRNECEVPLASLGIGEWLWGRAPLGDDEVVWYLLWPEGGGAPTAWGLRLSPDGRTTPVEGLTVRLAERRRSVYGLAWWDHVSLDVSGDTWLTVRHGTPVEDGPFYLRFFPVVEGAGLSGRGVAELVRPDRVDLDWMRPFVRMRVRPPGAGASMWLPLFEGPAVGRAGRLLGFGGG